MGKVTITMKQPRLPTGWVKLKVLDGKPPFQVVVNRDTGQFGFVREDGWIVNGWHSLVELELHLRTLQTAEEVLLYRVGRTQEYGTTRLIPFAVKCVSPGVYLSLDGDPLSLTDLRTATPELVAELDEINRQWREVRRKEIDLTVKAERLMYKAKPLE